MSSELDLLANSDAVLALSLNTINYNLSLLLRRNIIRRKWTLLWVDDPADGITYINNSPEATTEINEWIRIKNEAAQAFQDANFLEFGQLLGSLERQYTGAWNATIKRIYIEPVPEAPKRVLLKIEFGSGFLAMNDSDTKPVTQMSMAGVVYAFETPLAKLEVSVDDGSMLEDAEVNTKNFMESKGLSSDHFTVESILMDLQQANVAIYDANRSELPTNSTMVATAIATMFKQGMGEDEKRKYVLGYAVQRRNLKDIGSAMFQPTSVVFSVTHVEPPEDSIIAHPESSFNFHMMTQNRSPFNHSVLPRPLLQGQMNDPEVDGVYALRYSLFENNVLDDLVHEALEASMNGFKHTPIVEKEPGVRWQVNGTKTAKTHDIEFDLKSDDGKKPEKVVTESMTVTATVRPSDGDLEIKFVIDYSYRAVYRAWRLTKLIQDIGGAIGDFFTPRKKVRKVGNYATILDATSSTQKGSPAIISVRIQPGELGKLKVTSPEVLSNLDVEISAIKKSPHFNDSLQNFEALFSTKGVKGFMRDEIKKAVNAAKPSESLEEEVTKKAATAANLTDEVNALNIVLPLGNVYTFKDLDVARNSVSKMLEARVGYAPLEDADSEIEDVNGAEDADIENEDVNDVEDAVIENEDVNDVEDADIENEDVNDVE